MENDKFLKLTNTVYKVLEFFPEADPLKNRAKDKALAIMSRLSGIPPKAGEQSICEDIDMLLGYLWIAKSQGWLNSVNCLIITNEYEKIKKDIGPVIKIELTQKLPGILDKSPAVAGQFDEPAIISPMASLGGEQELSERQGKILEFLSKNKKAQVMDLQTILPNVTKRTIRRDLDELLESAKIVRLGDFNEVFYKIKGPPPGRGPAVAG